MSKTNKMMYAELVCPECGEFKFVSIDLDGSVQQITEQLSDERICDTCGTQCNITCATISDAETTLTLPIHKGPTF